MTAQEKRKGSPFSWGAVACAVQLVVVCLTALGAQEMAYESSPQWAAVERLILGFWPAVVGGVALVLGGVPNAFRVFLVVWVVGWLVAAAMAPVVCCHVLAPWSIFVFGVLSTVFGVVAAVRREPRHHLGLVVGFLGLCAMGFALLFLAVVWWTF